VTIRVGIADLPGHTCGDQPLVLRSNKCILGEKLRQLLFHGPFPLIMVHVTLPASSGAPGVPWQGFRKVP
jgi:hypothetical protein